MAAFKDKKNGSWYVQFRYTDWRGERQQKLKRGFATKKEAQAWEREFLMQKQADINMSFESFVALYEKDVKPKLKLNTWLSKEHIIRTKILPYFKKRKLSEITARDVIDWQNEIRQHTKSSGENYSPDYLKNVHTQLSCIFNHAIKYYGLQINPAAKAGNMQKKKRTALEATIDVVGRDQQDQILYLRKDADTQIWNLEKAENELHKEPPDHILEAVSGLVSAEQPVWTGSPSELADAVHVGMAANVLSKYLNVKSGRLLDEYRVRYENKVRHEGRRITLTYDAESK